MEFSIFNFTKRCVYLLTYARLEPCRRQPVRAVRRKAGCAGECLPFVAGECAHARGEEMSVSIKRDIDISTSLDVTGTLLDVTGTLLDVTGTLLDVTGSPLDVTGTSLDVTGTSLDVTG